MLPYTFKKETDACQVYAGVQETFVQKCGKKVMILIVENLVINNIIII